MFRKEKQRSGIMDQKERLMAKKDYLVLQMQHNKQEIEHIKALLIEDNARFQEYITHLRGQLREKEINAKFLTATLDEVDDLLVGKKKKGDKNE
jgi:serine phosphatase RsbU (regulator of sigma subunit)